MYAGRYLDDNIGHEVINLISDDKGRNYVYVNHDGIINEKYNDSVKAVLFVKHVEKGVLEIIAKAEGLKQVLYKSSEEEMISRQMDYINENEIRYGGVELYKVYGDKSNDKTADKISITFEAEKVLKVKKPFYLIHDEKKIFYYDSENNYRFLHEKNFASQKLKMYYDSDEYPEDYQQLDDLLSNDDIWEGNDRNQSIHIEDFSEQTIYNSFISIIEKDRDEQLYSNLLAYFFTQNKPLFCQFALDVLGVDALSPNFRICREEITNNKKRIDLLIYDSKNGNVIVIENKIDSKIHGVKKSDSTNLLASQLSEYYEHVNTTEKYEEIPQNHKYFFVFVPNHNNIRLEKYIAGDQFTPIQYSEIYDFYYRHAGDMIHVDYFREFMDALSLHKDTKDNREYEIMKRRFAAAIQRIKSEEER